MATEAIHRHGYASNMEQLGDVAAELFDRLLAVAQNIETDQGWLGQSRHVQDGVCMLFALVRNRTAGDRIESLTAELAGAHAALLVEQKRAENAENWRDAYKLALRHILELLPNEYRAPEDQARVMRGWDLVTDGEGQFKPQKEKP
jgi:hypothetical protein